MDNEEREKYLKAYYDNEANANKHMSFANAFAAFVVLLIWIMYAVGFFPVHKGILTLINISFPIAILILLSPIMFVFFHPKSLWKRRYKYFVVSTFIFVVAAINIIVPKHGIIGWALCIVITNHYYNPKLGFITFITTVITMLLCLYGGMFLGEYDPNLLGGGLIIDGKIAYIDGVKERYDMLHQMILEGDNRYLKVFLYYYLSRLAILSIIFMVSNALNRRTYNLLVSGIRVGNEQQKTRTELEVAKDIQLTSLPTEFMTSKDVEIQAELKAAKEIGGDFYDYFILDDERIAILIGDVSGKGIPAAMFMMKVITCFKNFINLSRSPSEILNQVNASIYKNNQSHMFVTCFLAMINTKTGETVFANAGHNPPIIGKNKNYRYLKCKHGFILGGLPKAPVEDEKLVLEEGETITLYTDGITEAMNKQRNLYGEERLLNLFNKKEYSCLIELHHDLKDDVEKFTDGAPQSDDMTYLTLQYHGDNYVYEEKLFDAKKENISEMLGFLEKFCNEKDIEPSFINKFLVVGDEIFSNIVNYAYPEGHGKIFIRLLHNIDKNEVILTVIDTGIEFNPFTINNSPIEGDVSNRKEGGMGILIVKNLMNEYAYDRINNKNIITLKKVF